MENHKAGGRWGPSRETLLQSVSYHSQNIFVWCGGKSNILERNKARDLASAIRDSERQGKAQVEIVTDGDEPAEMIQVEGMLGWVASPWVLPREAVVSGGMRVVSGGLGGGRLGHCSGLWLARRVPWCDSE